MKADNPQKPEYRIVSWSAQDFMGLHAVTIAANEVMTEITGKNGAGKTSAINALCWVLGGKEFAEAMPLRKGQKHGAVCVDLGALKATKTMDRRDGGEIDLRLVVEYADGSRPRKPDAVLAALCDKMMDPLAFARATGPQRIGMVQALFPEFDFAANARKRKEVFDKRTDVNRDHKREVAARDSIVLPEGERPKAISVADLNRQLVEANRTNDEIAHRRQRRELVADQADAKRDEAARMRARANELENEASALDNQLANAPELPAPIDTTALISDIENAEQINATVRLLEQWEARSGDILRLAARSRELTTQIEAIDAEKAKAMEGARLPFKGLAIGDDDVYLDGVLFEDIAFSQRMRASTAIAMALGSELRAMVIREYGSLLDADSWRLLCEDAKANGYQVIIESTDQSGPGKIIIADGRVVQNG